MWLNLRTEYQFGAVFGKVDDIAKRLAELKAPAAGIADSRGTWGHARWKKACTTNGIKPVYGVRLAVAQDMTRAERRYNYDTMSFIAMTNAGLQTLYDLVDLAHKQFFWRPVISYDQLNDVDSADVVIIGAYAPRLDLVKRKLFLELSPATPYATRNLPNQDYVACCDNWYIRKEDKIIYEPFADERLRERKTSAMHILTDDEWKAILPGRKEAIDIRDMVLDSAKAELPTAKMVIFPERRKLKKLCKEGAKAKNLELKGEYKARLKVELGLIKEKKFVDYFLVVADLIRFAKSKMVVGPSRGSSAGSLVCYLLGITEVDPLLYDLVFERFIDINRADLPDIDIDFQDDKRHLIVSYLQEKYGTDNVAQLGTINRLHPRSAITRFAKAFSIPAWEADAIKDAFFDRAEGDERASMVLSDTWETDTGRDFLTRYPNIKNVDRIEGHASHTGVHAAGVIVCNEPVNRFCGINSRDKERIAMIDKKDAEVINLLKIDALGLRTLTIFADICDAIGRPYDWIYSIPLDAPEVFDVLNCGRFAGVFQFEGETIQKLAKQMPIENLEDIAAICSVARPGPLGSGGADAYVARRSGNQKVDLVGHPDLVRHVRETYGVIVYQEQVMNICRHYAGLSWEDVGKLRKIIGKSMGEEAFGKYKEAFIEGAMANKADQEEAIIAWNSIRRMGSYAFNKSHAISYAIISYLCAWFKFNYPLDFAIATLNHSKDKRSSIKVLRDLLEVEGVQHIPASFMLGQEKWSKNGETLVEGFEAIEGIGAVSAKKIVACREKKIALPAGISKALASNASPFKYLYPAKEIYGDYYRKPKDYGVTGIPISEIGYLQDDGHVCIIGLLIKKDIRDLNEPKFVSKRDGEKVDGETTFLNLKLEDDTGIVSASIGAQQYQKIGLEVAAYGKPEVDWYMVYGFYDAEWNKIKVKNIRRITIG